MNTEPRIINFDMCTTQKEITFVDRPKTQPLISNAFIENVRDRGEDIDVHVVRQRVIDLCQTGEYSQGEIYAKVHARSSSTKSFKVVSDVIKGLVEGDIISVVETEYARKYTFSEIRESAIEEIANRSEIVEEYKTWIPQRWRKESPTTRSIRSWSIRCR